MKPLMQTLSAVAVCAVIVGQPVVADDSETLYRLQHNPPVTADMKAQEQALEARYEQLKDARHQKGLSHDEKKRIDKEYKDVKKQLKSLQKANKKAMKDYDKQVEKLEKSLAKQYGMGPYPYDIQRFVADKPEPLRPLYASLFIEGERNAVLNYNRLGLAALQLGYLKDATWAFDRSIDQIESIYANTPEAKAAKSKFQGEAVKDYKGEPYERAMAYYYRGLLYLDAGDYENAHAVFKAGEYQDTVSEAENFKADFAVLNFLSGWSLHCQGRGGADAFAEAKAFRPDLMVPADQDNTLLIAEMGAGPIKYGSGKYQEVLKFKPDTRYSETGAMFVVPTATDVPEIIPTVVASSVDWQASTRGGRPVTGILEGKAQFKDTTAAVGSTLQTAGTVAALAGAYSGNNDASLAGAGVALLGGLFSHISAKTVPAADTRRWDNLPDNIAVTTNHMDQIPADMTARFSGPKGNVAEPVPVAMTGGDNVCHIAWTRSRNAAAIPESSPGARMSWQEMRKRKENIQAQDVAFRTWLDTNAPAQVVSAQAQTQPSSQSESGK